MGILTFIKSIPTLIKTAKFWIIAAILASVVSGVVWFVKDYRDTLQELAVAEQTVDELTSDLNNVNAQIAEEKERIKELRQKNSTISSQYLAKVRELQEMKNNLEALKQNPDEGSAKIKASFNEFMNDISCITGESEQCPK